MNKKHRTTAQITLAEQIKRIKQSKQLYRKSKKASSYKNFGLRNIP